MPLAIGGGHALEDLVAKVAVGVFDFEVLASGQADRNATKLAVGRGVGGIVADQVVTRVETLRLFDARLEVIVVEPRLTTGVGG